LLQTLGPNTPVLPLILKGILQNSSLSNRGELIQALEQMSMPDPQAQQAAQQQQQMQLALVQAELADKQSKAQKQSAEAQKALADAQTAPQIAQAKIIGALSTNLNENNEGQDFERRLKLAELALKQEDIRSNERIATLQTRAKLIK
jgi:hypothetical protein